MTGASGRIWVANDGRFRIELQASMGDAQVVSDGKVVTAYDAGTKTAYRFALPQEKGAEKADHEAGGASAQAPG